MKKRQHNHMIIKDELQDYLDDVEDVRQDAQSRLDEFDEEAYEMSIINALKATTLEELNECRQIFYDQERNLRANR